MTHEAVSSITEDSGKWVGEIPTAKIGVWLDYAMLLVSFVSNLSPSPNVWPKSVMMAAKKTTPVFLTLPVCTPSGVLVVHRSHFDASFFLSRFAVAFHGKCTFSVCCRARHQERLVYCLWTLPLDACSWLFLQYSLEPSVLQQVTRKHTW